MTDRAYKRHIKRTFSLQHDQSDCGAACLLSIVRYYGGLSSLENIRKASGTDSDGTTLLGLQEAAQQRGLDAEGVEMDLQYLSQVSGPSILHVTVEDQNHYVVCYGHTPGFPGEWMIGDPAKGLVRITWNELKEMWHSKAALLLTPSDSFQTGKEERTSRRKWLMSFVQSDLYLLGPAIVSGVIVSLLGLTTALFSQKLVDNILPFGDTARLVAGITLMLVLLVGRLIVSHLRKHLMVIHKKEFNQRLTGELLCRLFALPRSFFDQRRTGDMLSRLNDTHLIQENIALIALMVLDDLFLIVIAVSLLGIYSLLIASVALILVPVVFVVATRFNAHLKSRQYHIKSSFGITESSYIEYLKGIDAVKENNRQDYFLRSITTIYNRYQQAFYDFGCTANHYQFAVECAGVTTLIAVMAVGSFMVINGGELTAGNFVAIMSVAATLVPAILRLATTHLQLQDAYIAFERMNELVSAQPENLGKRGRKDLQFEKMAVKELSFRFPGRPNIFTNVNLHVEAGEIIAVNGRTGSGKSTLLLVLQKFYKAQAGNIHVNGECLNLISTAAWRDLVASVPQEVKIFSGPLFQNILFGSVSDSESFANFCREYDFDRFFNQLPLGYETIIGEDGIKLSGGQKQLVGLARALFRRPKLLLLDEPTSAMDKNMAIFVYDLLRKLKQAGVAIVLVTHSSEAVEEVADRAYDISNNGDIR